MRIWGPEADHFAPAFSERIDGSPISASTYCLLCTRHKREGAWVSGGEWEGRIDSEALEELVEEIKHAHI